MFWCIVWFMYARMHARSVLLFVYGSHLYSYVCILNNSVYVCAVTSPPCLWSSFAYIDHLTPCIGTVCQIQNCIPKMYWQLIYFLHVVLNLNFVKYYWTCKCQLSSLSEQRLPCACTYTYTRTHHTAALLILLSWIPTLCEPRDHIPLSSVNDTCTVINQSDVCLHH